MSSGSDISEALRAALQSSAEVGLARSIISVNPAESIGQFIDARLSHLSANDLSYIQSLAHSILNAADYISSLDNLEAIDPDQIPENPAYDPLEWQGGRLKWFGEWSIPGFPGRYKFSGTLPDITDFGDIVAYAAELANSYIEAYPTRFAGSETLEGMTPEVRILGIEKGF